MPSRFIKRQQIVGGLLKEAGEAVAALVAQVAYLYTESYRRYARLTSLTMPTVQYKTMLLCVACLGLVFLLLDSAFIRSRSARTVRLYDSEMELVRKRV
jgi:hypothetical protein